MSHHPFALAIFALIASSAEFGQDSTVALDLGECRTSGLLMLQ